MMVLAVVFDVESEVRGLGPCHIVEGSPIFASSFQAQHLNLDRHEHEKPLLPKLGDAKPWTLISLSPKPKP